MLLTATERLVELILLALVALPLVRVAADPGLRRRFKAFPPVQPFLPIALAAYAVAIVAAFLWAPVLLRPAAVLALGVIAYEVVQRRPRAGADRGLPPGSLSFFPMAPWKDPDFFRKSAGRWGSTFKFRHLSRPAVAIVGLDQITGFLQAHTADISSPPAPFNTILPGGFVRYLRGSEHLDTAVMLRSAMSRNVVAQCSSYVDSQARLAVCTMGRDARAWNNAIDDMIRNVMMRCFLGLDRGADLDRFIDLYRTADYRRLATTGKGRAREAIDEIIREMRVIAARDDAECSFLVELAKAHPAALQSDAMMGSFAYALHTARVDATGLMVWMLAVAGENSEWIRTLRGEYASNPEEGEVGGLADRMVRETLRLRQSEFIIRKARNDIAWNGFTIPRGWHVRLCINESHRSADAFDDPERFDPERFVRTPTRSRYAPFGFAPHLCPGEHLTRWIGRKLFVELARTCDITAHDVTPWEFGGFHWQPNRRMKIELSPVHA